MAVVKLGTTASANRLISYCEKRAAEREGVLCDPDHAKSQFKATRSMWGKEGGVQAHSTLFG